SHGIAISDPRFGFLAVLGAHIYPDIREQGHLVALFIGQKVRRTPSYHTSQWTFARPDRQILAQENLHVPASDRLNVQEAVIVDILHHEPDLIAVAGEHDAGLASGVDHRDDIAVPISANLVCKTLGPGSDNFLNGTLESGRTGRFEKIFKKRVGDFLHR